MAAQVILVHLVHVRVVVSQHKRRFGTNSFETPFFGIELFFILTALRLGTNIASMPFDRWPCFPSYGAYFRNVADVVLDDVAFSTIGPDDRDDLYTDNVPRLKR